jgi:hypothetical protein
LYGYGLIDKNDKVRNLISCDLAEATISATLIDKYEYKIYCVEEADHFTQTLLMNYEPFQTSYEQTSFASGHSTLGFCFFIRYGKRV